MKMGNNLNLSFDPNGTSRILRMIRNILIVIFILISVFMWLYTLLVAETTLKNAILPVLLGCALPLLGNLVFVLFIGGYDSENLSLYGVVTYVTSVIFTLILLYIFKTALVFQPAEIESQGLYQVANFFIYAGIAVVMTIFPAILITLIMYCIVRIFGKQA